MFTSQPELPAGTPAVLEGPASRSVDEALAGLKRRLDSITDYFDPCSRIVYYDYPIYASNIGDLLIHAGTESFFRARKLEIWRRFNMLDLPHDIRHMDSSVVILCHGGGNFGNLWAGSQEKREQLMARYPDNRIIVLPQTVHFTSRDAAESSFCKLREHKNLHIFARDHVSERSLKDAGLSASCMPDMYHALEGEIAPVTTYNGGRTLRLCRTDQESGGEMGEPVGFDLNTDWMDIIGAPCLLLARCGQAAMIALRIAGVQSPYNHKLWYPIKDLALQRGIRMFSQFDVIHTDRLHAMLLALLLRRTVHAYDNCYGKLSSYYDCWLAGTEGIVFHRGGLHT